MLPDIRTTHRLLIAATDNPDATVTFNFASWYDPVTQVNEGAPADVYACADEASMTKLTDAAGNAGEPGAQAFVEFVLSESGRKILDTYGFGAP